MQFRYVHDTLTRGYVHILSDVRTVTNPARITL